MMKLANIDTHGSMLLDNDDDHDKVDKDDDDQIG